MIRRQSEITKQKRGEGEGNSVLGRGYDQDKGNQVKKREKRRLRLVFLKFFFWERSR